MNQKCSTNLHGASNKLRPHRRAANPSMLNKRAQSCDQAVLQVFPMILCSI